MANEYKLSFTAEEIDEKLRKVDCLQNVDLTDELNFANSIKAKASGEVVRIDDISPIAHKVKCKFDVIHKTLPIMDKIVPYSKETVTVEGNTVKIGAGSIYGFKLSGSSLEVGKTYTFSIDSISDNVNECKWRISYADGTNETENYPTDGLYTTTISKEVEWIRFIVGMPYAAANDVYIVNPQITEGDSGVFYRICHSKNLIQFPYAFGEAYTHNGITAVVQDDGGVVLNGTATGDAFFPLMRKTPIDSNHLISSYTKYNKENYLSSRKFVSNATVGNDVDFDIGWYVYSNVAGYTYLAVRANTVCENEVVYPQIEIGQKSTSYEKGESLQFLTIDENGYCEIP